MTSPKRFSGGWPLGARNFSIRVPSGHSGLCYVLIERQKKNPQQKKIQTKKAKEMERPKFLIKEEARYNLRSEGTEMENAFQVFPEQKKKRFLYVVKKLNFIKYQTLPTLNLVVFG